MLYQRWKLLSQSWANLCSNWVKKLRQNRSLLFLSWVQLHLKWGLFSFCFGETGCKSMHVSLGCKRLGRITDMANFIKTAQQRLQKVRKIASKKVNKTHDKKTPLFNAKWSLPINFEEGNLVSRWRFVSDEGHTWLRHIVETVDELVWKM